MNVVSTVFVGWAMLLIGLRFGYASSILYDRQNETSLASAEERRVRRCEGSFLDTPRKLQVRNMLAEALNRPKKEVNCLYNYGCWCGLRGEESEKYVDNMDFCCKVHDFCEAELGKSCKGREKKQYMEKKLKYDGKTMECVPLSEYGTSNVQEKQCRHAVCLCDMELVRCITHYNNEINFDNMGYRGQCTVPASDYCKTKADVVILIQDSEGISSTTAGRIKTVVQRMLTLLSNESEDYNFALATYATSRKISCFGSAEDTISYLDGEYRLGGSGRNLLNLALSEMILEQFDKRRDDRKDDNTAKILVIFSDGNAEDESGEVMDTFWLEKTAKRLRVDNNIKIIGALIPNTQNTQRLQELKGIVSDKDAALNIKFSSRSLRKIANSLAARVRHLVCRVQYTVQVYTPDTHVNDVYRLTIRVQGEGGQTTAEHVLRGATQHAEGNLQVIQSQFVDRDVRTVDRIEILPDRTHSWGRGEWYLNKVKIRKGDETVTAVFKKEIPEWSEYDAWFSAKAWRQPFVTYKVGVYSPNTFTGTVDGLTIRIKGTEQETDDHSLPITDATEEMEGDLHVRKARFTGVNVGDISRIMIRPSVRRAWLLNKVKVEMGEQTVTAEFNDREIPAHNWHWVYAPARASNPPTDV